MSNPLRVLCLGLLVATTGCHTPESAPAPIATATPVAEPVATTTPAAETPAVEVPAAAPTSPPKPTAPAVDPLAELNRFLATADIDRSAPSWRLSLPMPPKLAFDPQMDYFLHLETSAGVMRIKLFADTAPMHVSSCLYLCKLGFYNGLNFHRIIPGFMAQGGCPTGTGRDGPGYRFGSEFEGGRKHDKRGILSMAHAGEGTDGSQFFLTFGPTPHLDNRHTVWGEIVDGLPTLQALERAGTQGGQVSEPPVIQKAWVRAAKKG